MRREAVRAAAGRPQELSQQAVTRDSAGAGAPAAQGADPIAGDPTTATDRSGANPRAPAWGPGAFLQGRPPSPEPIPGHSTPRPPRTDARPPPLPTLGARSTLVADQGRVHWFRQCPRGGHGHEDRQGGVSRGVQLSAGRRLGGHLGDFQIRRRHHCPRRSGSRLPALHPAVHR